MLQRLPIALAKIKAGNNLESLLNEIRQIVFSLYQSKEITKKVYNNIIKSIIQNHKIQYKMDTIFMNSENSRTFEYHVLVLKLTDKSDLRIGQKNIALSNLSIYYTWKNIKSSYNNNKFKIPAPTWSEEIKLPDESYSISDIQDYFEYILKKHSENVDNPSIRIYVNKIENRITFKFKNGYYLVTPGKMKLLGSTESKITKDKNGENVPHLEVVDLELVHCNLVNNDYQQDSRILYTFVPNKPFGLLEISPTNHTFLKTFNSEFQEIKIWFPDQTSKPLEVEDRINLTLRGYGFPSFARNIDKNISNKYSQKLVESAIKSGATNVATDAIKTASKRAIQKADETFGDVIGSRIADKIRSASKKSSTELHSKNNPSPRKKKHKKNNLIMKYIPKERHISPKERQQVIDELRLI